MSPFEEAVYGAGGATLWIVLVYGLPTAFAAAPFLVDAASAKEAFALGLGWQGVFWQFTKAQLDRAGGSVT